MGIMVQGVEILDFFAAPYMACNQVGGVEGVGGPSDRFGIIGRIGGSASGVR